MHETIFCQKFLAATSNLREEQNLVHLGRFLHFSQKVVGVTLSRMGITRTGGLKKRVRFQQFHMHFFILSLLHDNFLCSTNKQFVLQVEIKITDKNSSDNAY